MKPGWLFQGGLFTVVFLLGLCVMAPVALVNGYLKNLSSGRLVLAQTRGTLWNGSGMLLFQHDTQFLPLGYYGWRIRLAASFTRLNVNLNTGQDARDTQIQITPWKRELIVQRVTMRLPAQLLSLFAPQLSPYRLTGTLELAAENLMLTPKKNTGRIVLDWKQAASGLTDIAPLGDYRIDLQCEELKWNIALTTQSGKLRLSGTGQVEPWRGGAFTFNGTAQAGQAEETEALSELLHHIGPEISPGVFALALVQQ